MSRVYLSPPDMKPLERELLLAAFDSNWIAPVGPDLDAFEREMTAYVGVYHAVSLSSGTAALHLALQVLGVGPGDDVLVPSLTFVATAAAVTYLGARPVFLDSSPRSWNLDPDLLAAELDQRARAGRQVAAVVAVDLYGQCADYTVIVPRCREYGVPLVEDAAEGLGASHQGRAAGSFGAMATFSFNGNKILTTGGGGMLVSASKEMIARARYLATQARDPVPHYEHAEIGYNYRLSNLLAAVGRGQLASLDDRVSRRQHLNRLYREAFEGIPGVAFMPADPAGIATWWLTCITVDPEAFGATREDIRLRLEEVDIESRPTWKPLHLQPAFAGCPVRGGSVSEAVFATGLCLPSGSNMTNADLNRVIDVVLAMAR